MAGAERIERSHFNRPVDHFIERIRERPLDGRDMMLGDVVETHEGFHVHEMSYISDGLRITGLIAIPLETGPHPGVIINHGFFPVDRYYPGKGTKHEMGALAARGYLVAAPDYRGYGNSDPGDNTFLPGFVHDVRNLVPALSELEQVDSSRLAMMGHSMGAGITLQCLATGSNVHAAALLGAVTAREPERYEARRYRWTNGTSAARSLEDFVARFGTPTDAPDSYERMSTINYLDAITAPIIMHHGAKDEVCPITWGFDLRDALLAAGKTVEFHQYTDAGHVLRDADFEQMVDRTDRFFRRQLLLT